MATTTTQPAAPARKGAARGRVLWIWTAVVAAGAAVFAFGLDQALSGSGITVLQAVKFAAYDAGMTLHAERSANDAAGSPPVVVLPIDGLTDSVLKSMEPPELRQFTALPARGAEQITWHDHPRWFHAQVVRNLTALGARVIVFDMVFDLEDKLADPVFADAIRKHGHVILAGADQRGDPFDHGYVNHQLVVPNATLRNAALDWAVATVQEDRDEAIRSFHWWWKGIDERTTEDTVVPPLGIAAVSWAAGLDPKWELEHNLVPQRRFMGTPVIAYPNADGTLSSQITYNGITSAPAGPSSLVEEYSRVFRNQDPDRLRQLIAGKIVLIGDSSQLAQDRHPAPVYSPLPNGGRSRQMPGVEIQAQIALTALRGRYVREAAPWVEAALLVLCCAAVAVAGRVLSPRWLTFAVILLLTGLWVGCITVLDRSLYHVQPVTATVGVLVATIAESALMYWGEQRDLLRARRQMKRHLGAEVADKLANEEIPEMSGERVPLTMLFSDLQGFTTLSETMESTEIFQVLQQYFTIILPILDRHDGAMDKLMGDGMMAHFGWAPRHADHAARAVRCAVEMQRALDDWQRRPENAHLPPLKTRIGIHTGVATVGEVGMGERVGLTVIGDVVNVASRLEGMNKEFGTTILISEATREAAGDLTGLGVLRFRGAAKVRGRVEPMPVYSLETGPEPQAAPMAEPPHPAMAG